MLRNSRCVNKYPKKVLKCISKLDKELQYAVIDGLEKGGDDLVREVKNLDDDAAESFIKTDSKQKDSFYDYLKSLDESYLNELVASSKADIDKISKWDYQPDYELYVRHKSVYNNPKYFEQTTGKTIWPTEDGFKDGIIPQPQVISEGTCFKRYGDSSGSFLGNTTDSFESRSLAPYADGTVTWAKVSSTGAINIFNELEPCLSCRSVINQFNRAYPGIVVNVYWK